MPLGTCPGNHERDPVEGAKTKGTRHKPEAFADLVVESLYPQKCFKNHPYLSFLSASALLTRNLAKNLGRKPKASATMALGMTTALKHSLSPKLRGEARANGKKLRVAEIWTLCGAKHAEVHVAQRASRAESSIKETENNQLIIFSDTSTNPMVLTALNAC